MVGQSHQSPGSARSRKSRLKVACTSYDARKLQSFKFSEANRYRKSLSLEAMPF
jgi:hypothetical protein